VIYNGKEERIKGNGNGPVSALIDALGQFTGVHLDVRELVEHAIGKGKNTRAAAYIEVTAAEHGEKGFWGVGIDEDTVRSFLRSLCLMVVCGKHESCSFGAE